MGNWRSIGETVDELEALQLGLANVVRDARQDWRLELVQRRRAVSKLVSQLASQLDEMDRAQAIDAVWRLDIRGRLSEFRAALATHQARYPAVAMETGSRDYLASVDKVRITSAAFFALVRRALATNGDGKGN